MKGQGFLLGRAAMFGLLAMLLLSLLVGCKGDTGAQGPAGTNGNDGTDATLPLNGVPSATENLQAQITSAVVSSTTGSLVVTFKLLDEKGAPIDPRNIITAGGRCRFYVAQIDSTGYYKNYFTSSGLPTYDPASLRFKRGIIHGLCNNSNPRGLHLHLQQESHDDDHV
jgi:hypothetical protein